MVRCTVCGESHRKEIESVTALAALRPRCHKLALTCWNAIAAIRASGFGLGPIVTILWGERFHELLRPGGNGPEPGRAAQRSEEGAVFGDVRVGVEPLVHRLLEQVQRSIGVIGHGVRFGQMELVVRVDP